MLKFNYINEFIILAETLNFSKTAELTFITQPALSRHIAIFEEEMGAQLFERTTRSVSLTAAGEATYKACTNILHIWNAAKESAAFLSESQNGTIGIGSPYYWTEDYTEPIVRYFQEKHPASNIRLVSCQPHQGIEDLNTNHTDIFISYYISELDSSVRRVSFAKEPLCLVCLDNHPFSNRISVKLSELAGQSFIALGYGSSNYQQHHLLITDLLAKHGVYPVTMNYTQQVDTLGLALQKTGSISIMPYGTRHLDRSYLRFIPLDDDDCWLPMCLYYRMENQNPLLPQLVQAAMLIFNQ